MHVYHHSCIYDLASLVKLADAVDQVMGLLNFLWKNHTEDKILWVKKYVSKCINEHFEDFQTLVLYLLELIKKKGEVLEISNNFYINQISL